MSTKDRGLMLYTHWLPSAMFLIAFLLVIDWVRAEGGCLGDLTTHQINLERAQLDADRRGQHRDPTPIVPSFEAA